MAHAAELDSNNIVIRVLAFDNSLEPNVVQFATNLLGGNWVQTSYNNNIRKQYCGIGYSYNAEADVFVAPQPFTSWSLDSNYDWQPPVARPTDDKFYTWSEDDLTWKEVVND